MQHFDSNNADNAQPTRIKDGSANKRWWEKKVDDDDAPSLPQPNRQPEGRSQAPSTAPDNSSQQPPPPPQQRSPLRRANIPQEPMQAPSAPDLTPPPKPDARAPGSNKRWWEDINRRQGHNAPVPPEIQPEPPAAAPEPRQQPQASSGAFKRATAQPAENNAAEARPSGAFGRASVNNVDAAPRGAFGRADNNNNEDPPLARVNSPRSGSVRPEALDDDDAMAQEAPAPASQPSKRKGLFGKPSPQPVMEDEDDLIEDAPAPVASASSAKRKGLFGRAAPKSAPAPEPDYADEEEVMDEPVQELSSSIPKPRGARVESKKGPRVAAPNNAFAHLAQAKPKSKLGERKPMKMPPGPVKAAYDMDAASAEQQRLHQAQQRKVAARNTKSFVRRITGPVIVVGACAALLWTGLVEIVITPGLGLKVNVPAPLQPVVAKAAPVFEQMSQRVSESAQPMVTRVVEMFTIPTPTPSPGRNFGFANGASNAAPAPAEKTIPVNTPAP